jgi:hypothetical protein
MVNLSASSPPIVQVTPPPTLESPVKVGVGLVNASLLVGRAIRKISLYNGEDNDPVPTVQDYKDAGLPHSVTDNNLSLKNLRN